MKRNVNSENHQLNFWGHLSTLKECMLAPRKSKPKDNASKPDRIKKIPWHGKSTKQVPATNCRAIQATKRPTEFESHWLWGDAQQRAFAALKESLASTPTLAHYDASHQMKLSSDASSYGLEAVLMQLQDNGEWHPVAYASRAMSPTEQCYAQIEKEALGIT